MIGFDLTPEQRALQKKARQFSKEVILPVAAKHDRDGTFPLDVWKIMGGFLHSAGSQNMGTRLGVLDNCIISGTAEL
jgi:acyl-CoA dehydrogenase